jgi:predicted DNA-binding protein (MmcQ/YjbR family)
MDIDAIRRHCLGLPHTTENVQWGADLCFKVGERLFAVAPLELAPVRLSFKCTPESFVELCERPGIIPAPYMARAQWVAMQSLDAVPDDELRGLLAKSYSLVWERLPQKLREGLERTARAGSKPGAGGRIGVQKSASRGQKASAGPRP